ncbi:MAG: minor capsid protein, partial [Armatimonadetes bacterium]|nr:minor capsid protein [Candidatus Hippobium faecium]
MSNFRNNELTHGLVTGKPYNEIVSEMEKKLNTERHNIERLVRTEASFIKNQAELSAYYKSGIKEYEYLARLDERTSPQCR